MSTLSTAGIPIPPAASVGIPPLTERERHETARRALQLIGANASRTLGRNPPIPPDVCPSCWTYGKAIPLRPVCPFCAERAERKAGR